MKKEFDVRKSLEEFFKEKGVKAVFIIPRDKPNKLQEPLDLSELTQRDR